MSGMRPGPGLPVGPRVRLTPEQRAALSFDPIELPTAADTRAFGARLATILRVGDLLVLIGPLGAGKTALTQGIGVGLRVSGAVASPTFVIARVHPGTPPLIHVDAYRLGSAAEVDDLDLDVDLADAVTVIEWGEGLVEQLSEDRLEIALARAPDSEVRTVRLMPRGAQWVQRLRAAGYRSL